MLRFDALARRLAVLAGFVALTLPACSNKSGGGGRSCDTDADCPAGRFCDTLVTQQCYDSACSEHIDCPVPYLCSTAGSCYDPENGQRPSCEPLHPGCACTQADFALQIDCDPPEQPAGVDKSCHSGQSECDGERYGPCVDTYNVTCDNIHFGTGDFFPTEDNSNNVTTGVEGEILLDPDERQIDFGFLWIANTGENTVSKIDVDTGMEVARYAAVLDLPETAVPMPYPSTDPYGDCANCPSRTAIDFNGDAYVANRAFSRQGSVTKFANIEEECVDRNGNGMIDTSTDVNQDGYIDVNDTNEFLGYGDECILWTSLVGGIDALPRAIAIDAGSVPDWGANGNVWVGLFNEQSAVMLNGDDGVQVLTVDLSSQGVVHPYGAAVDALGFVWFTSINDGRLAKVDTFNGALVQTYDKLANTACAGAYGIAIDVQNRIWLAGFDCNTAARFDPETGDWATISFAGLGPHTRGIAPDLAGTVWVAHTSGSVSRFDAETLTPIDNYPTPHHLAGEATDNTIGVGIDRNGACWSISRNDAYSAGTATRISPGGVVDSFPVGLMPYTYSDFTGFGLSTVTRPSGWYNVIVSACEDDDPNNPPDITTDWHGLTWAELEPPGTNVRLRFKVADTVADLDGATWYGPFDDPDVDLDALGVPDTQFMLVQILLSSADANQSPAFLGFDLDFTCTGGPVIN